MAALRGDAGPPAAVQPAGGGDDHRVDVAARPSGVDVDEVGDHGDHRDAGSGAGVHRLGREVVEERVEGDDRRGSCRRHQAMQRGAQRTQGRPLHQPHRRGRVGGVVHGGPHPARPVDEGSVEVGGATQHRRRPGARRVDDVDVELARTVDLEPPRHGGGPGAVTAAGVGDEEEQGQCHAPQPTQSAVAPRSVREADRLCLEPAGEEARHRHLTAAVGIGDVGLARPLGRPPRCTRGGVRRVTRGRSAGRACRR